MQHYIKQLCNMSKKSAAVEDKFELVMKTLLKAPKLMA